MLIPIGFFGGAVAGDYELIQTVNGNNGFGYFEFSSIPQTYKHLQIRTMSRITGGGDSYNVNGLRINGMAGGYDYQVINFIAEGSSVLTTNGYDSSYVPWWSTNYTSDTSRYGGSIIEIPDYTAFGKKPIKIQFTNGWEARTGQNAGVTYQDVSNVSSIQIFSASGGNFTSASRFSLYGIKG
jgi:hypothetical protein